MRGRQAGGWKIFQDRNISYSRLRWIFYRVYLLFGFNEILEIELRHDNENTEGGVLALSKVLLKISFFESRVSANSQWRSMNKVAF